MVDRKDKRFFDFMCSCSDESSKKCDEVYEDVKTSFGVGTTDKGFITEVVYSLQFLDNGAANIEHIYADMWSGISVKYEAETASKSASFWVECDKIHHGLARVYQLVKEYDSSVK